MATNWTDLALRAHVWVGEKNSGSDSWWGADADFLIPLGKIGEQEFIIRTRMFVTEKTANLVSGTAEYTCPTDPVPLAFHSIIADGTMLQRGVDTLLYREYGESWRTETGAPKYARRLIPTKRTLVPIPDESVTNGLIWIYTYLPAQSTAILIPDAYGIYLQAYMAYSALAGDTRRPENVARAQGFLKFFYSGVSLYLKREKLDGSPAVWNPAGDDSIAIYHKEVFP